MPIYHIHFIDHGQHIYATERTKAGDDTHAIEAAHAIDVPSIGAGFEIWDGLRLVHREWRPAKRRQPG